MTSSSNDHEKLLFLVLKNKGLKKANFSPSPKLIPNIMTIRHAEQLLARKPIQILSLLLVTLRLLVITRVYYKVVLQPLVVPTKLVSCFTNSNKIFSKISKWFSLERQKWNKYVKDLHQSGQVSKRDQFVNSWCKVGPHDVSFCAPTLHRP